MADVRVDESTRPTPVFAAASILPIAALTALAHCAAALLGTGYWFDEVYMLAIGRHHLDCGSADQPPVTPALAALLDAVAPGSAFALRLPAVVATAGAVVLAAGAIGLQHRRESRQPRRRWLGRSVIGLAVATAVAILVLSVQITRSDVGEQIARQTAQAYRALAGHQRDHTAVMGESYIVAAYLDGYATTYGLPAAYSPNRSYGYFDPPPDSVDSVLYVGSEPDTVRPYFHDCPHCRSRR